jgi:DNA polymerase III subunit delta
MDALDFLEKPRLFPVMVVYGDEDFLRRQVHHAIHQLALGDAGDECSLAVFPGDKSELAQVLDEVQTVPLFGDRRLVIVEQADTFVTRYRTPLEKAFTAGLSPTNVLVIDVKSWAATTRLAHQLGSAAAIACKAPAPYRMPQWCVRRSAAEYQKKLAAPAAALLVDLVGPEMGLLDQELLKLSLYVGQRPDITSGDVDQLVGRSRAESTWKIFDAIAAGDAKQSLLLLDRLFDQGEEPIRLISAFSFQLRRLVKAYRLNSLGKPLGLAIEEAGFASFSVKQAEQQLKHLGRRRLDKLYDWLIEADHGLKGGSQLPPRTLFEQLILRLVV